MVERIHCDTYHGFTLIILNVAENWAWSQWIYKFKRCLRDKNFVDKKFHRQKTFLAKVFVTWKKFCHFLLTKSLTQYSTSEHFFHTWFTTAQSFATTTRISKIFFLLWNIIYSMPFYFYDYTRLPLFKISFQSYPRKFRTANKYTHILTFFSKFEIISYI